VLRAGHVLFVTFAPAHSGADFALVSLKRNAFVLAS
jgi:hypothetical protein